MYTLKILEDKEFEALPFKHVRDPFTLGCADQKTGTAYVRRVHWGEISPAVNMLTIQHEIEELVSRISPHEEDGIRYKKGKDIFTKYVAPVALALIPGVGPALSGIYTGVQGYQESGDLGSSILSGALSFGAGSLGQGTAGYKAGVEASKAAGGGILGQTLTGAQGMVFGTAGLGANQMSLLGPGGAPVGALNPAAWGYSPGFTQAAGEAVKTTGVSEATGFSDWWKSPLTKMGLGAMALSALPLHAEQPQMGDIISKWLTSDTVTKAGAKAREIADVEYAGEFQLSKETSAFMDVMENDIRKAYKMRVESLDKSMAASNEQWKRSGERLELMRRIDEEEQREIDTMRAQWIQQAKSEHAQRQYTYVMDQLQADEATKRDLLYGELSDVLLKYNVKEADLLNFRKIAADAGMYMVAKGTGLV